MLRKFRINFRKSVTVWTFALILLASNVHIEAAKATRRGGYSKTKNHDAIALSYGGNRGASSQQHHTKQVYQQRTSAPAPSAPQMPTNTKPIGWNIPAANTPVQQKTVSNTNTGYPAQTHHPGYPVQNNNPPPYSAHQQYPQQQPNIGANSYNSHPAGPPPAYNQPGYNSHVPAGPPPAYSAPNGAANVGYPQQNTYPQQGIFTNQQPGLHNPGSAYPAGYNVPNGQQIPVVNNYYGSPQQTGSSGGSLAKNALLLGGGALAGAALYGALTPDQEKTVHVIHENQPPNQPPNTQPNAPPAPAAAPVQPSDVKVDGIVTAPPNVPPPQYMSPMPNVPLAPMVDPLQQSTIPNMPPLGETTTNVPLASLPENSNNTNSAQQMSSNINTSSPGLSVSTPVPLAPFPANSDPAAQAQLKGAASYLLASTSVCIFTTVSIILAKLI